MARQAIDRHLFIVLGGTGDLTRRKLLPALQRLMLRGHFQDRLCILGVGRRAGIDDVGYRKWAQDSLESAGISAKGQYNQWCNDCLYYHSIGGGTADDYRGLARRIAEFERRHKLPQNRLFYIALPPAALSATVLGLGQAGLNRSKGWTRIVVEKPFGHDLASAQELNRYIHKYFDESQTYRIDHYLGKETVQNLLAFRFANPIFESVWNRERIQSVHIMVAETEGVGARGSYYEQTGAIRDMVQNHLTQLLALTAMEVPAAFEAHPLRDERAKLVRSVAPIHTKDVVLGQYGAGRIGPQGERVHGYRQEKNVSPDSTTETFAALRLFVSNWRWAGVPFYLVTGKRLPERCRRISVAFRCPPFALFREMHQCELHSNVLTITLEPDEGFDLSFEVKAPGEPFTLKTQRLHFRYSEAFGLIPEAYETLLLDVLRGDQSLFVHADEVDAAWKLYTPLLRKRLRVYPYPAGSWGPPEAAKFLSPEICGTLPSRK